MRSIFITGTDTGVGKTFVCALLLKFLRQEGIAAGYQKWVCTGDETMSADLQYCLKHAGIAINPAEVELQVPYRFRFPASPHLAASLENQTIDPESIVAKYNELGHYYDILVVEGVGGLLVPLRTDLLLADLLAGLRPQTLVVARSGLGTINHSLLTLEALRSRKIPVLGVVFSDSSPNEEELIVQDNMRTISKLGKVRVLGRLKWCDDPEEAQAAFASIGQAVLDCLPLGT